MMTELYPLRCFKGAYHPCHNTIFLIFYMSNLLLLHSCIKHIAEVEMHEYKMRTSVQS